MSQEVEGGPGKLERLQEHKVGAGLNGLHEEGSSTVVN